MMNKQFKRKSINLIQPGYRYLVIIFTVLALILIGIILYFALSQATVYLVPNFLTQQIGFAVQVINKDKVKETDDLSEKLAGKIVSSSIEETKTYPALQYQETTNKAAGAVTIINNYSRNQTLIATTRLLTAAGKLYRLTETVVAPSGKKITAFAQADQAGKEYEIGPTKFTIPGLWDGLRDKIYAESAESFKIQTLSKTKITQQTLDQAKEDLKSILLNKAKEDLKRQLLGKEALPEKALAAEILKYSTNAKVGSNQEEFSVTLALGVKGVVFNETRLKEIVQKNLPEIYKTNNALIKIDPASFNYEIGLLDENSENLIAQIKGEYTIQIANIQIKPGELIRMSKKDAVRYLKSFGDIKDASIFLPFWTNYLPALADKINIQIKNP